MNNDGYPKNSIEFCLNFGNVSHENLDFVVFASNNVDPDYILSHQGSDRDIDDWIREMHEFLVPQILSRRNPEIYRSF